MGSPDYKLKIGKGIPSLLTVYWGTQVGPVCNKSLSMRQSAWKRDSKVAPRVQALGFRVEGLRFPVRKLAQSLRRSVELFLFGRGLRNFAKYHYLSILRTLNHKCNINTLVHCSHALRSPLKTTITTILFGTLNPTWFWSLDPWGIQGAQPPKSTSFAGPALSCNA